MREIISYNNATSQAGKTHNHTIALNYEVDSIRPMKTIKSKKEWVSDRQRTAIRGFMAAHDLKVQPWCKKAGITEGALRNFLNGDNNAMGADNLELLAMAVGVTLADILDVRDDWQTVLIVGSVAAGKWAGGEYDTITHMVPFRSRREGLIGLTVDGQSMNRYAAEGQAIIIDTKDISPSDNDLVVARCNDQYTFKRYKANPRRLEPFSTEPDYQPIYYTDDECVILGKVLGAATPIKIDEII